MNTVIASTSPTFVDRRATAAGAAAPAHGAPRFDMYLGIHKGLRDFMSRTLVRVGRIDVADAADLDAGLAELEELLEFCAGHVRHENDFVHTAIEARQPAGSVRTADDHVDHLEAIASLREEAATLAGAGALDAPRRLARLYRHLALFVAENFQHMHIEETMMNALLWQHYSDAELQALHGRLLDSLTMSEKMTSMRWIVPASTPAERAEMIAGARQEMPPEALLGLMTALRPHLDASGWRKMARAAGVAEDVGG